MVSRIVTEHGNSTERIFDGILTELRADPKIGPTLNTNDWRREEEWVFNNAGGAMGSMYIIHASVTEVRFLPVSLRAHRPIDMSASTSSSLARPSEPKATRADTLYVPHPP